MSSRSWAGRGGVFLVLSRAPAAHARHSILPLTPLVSFQSLFLLFLSGNFASKVQLSSMRARTSLSLPHNTISPSLVETSRPITVHSVHTAVHLDVHVGIGTRVPYTYLTLKTEGRREC